MKMLIALLSLFMTATVFQGCKNDDDDINPDDFANSYYDGTYTPQSTTHSLTATVDGVEVTNTSAKATFRSSDGQTATITLSNIISGETSKVFTNVSYATGVSDNNPAIVFDLKDGDKDYGTGAIINQPFSEQFRMTLQLKE